MRKNNKPRPQQIANGLAIKAWAEDRDAIAASGFTDLAERFPALRKYADTLDRPPRTIGGTLAQLTADQHAVYAALAAARTRGSITREEWQAGLAAIREMEPVNAPPHD